MSLLTSNCLISQTKKSYLCFSLQPNDNPSLALAHPSQTCSVSCQSQPAGWCLQMINDHYHLHLLDFCGLLGRYCQLSHYPQHYAVNSIKLGRAKYVLFSHSEIGKFKLNTISNWKCSNGGEDLINQKTDFWQRAERRQLGTNHKHLHLWCNGPVWELAGNLAIYEQHLWVTIGQAGSTIFYALTDSSHPTQVAQ